VRLFVYLFIWETNGEIHCTKKVRENNYICIWEGSTRTVKKASKKQWFPQNNPQFHDGLFKRFLDFMGTMVTYQNQFQNFESHGRRSFENLPENHCYQVSFVIPY
jgi:hypothetical protein